MTLIGAIELVLKDKQVDISELNMDITIDGQDKHIDFIELMAAKYNNLIFMTGLKSEIERAKSKEEVIANYYDYIDLHIQKGDKLWLD